MSLVVVPLKKKKHPKAEMTDRKHTYFPYHSLSKKDDTNQSSTVLP